HPSTLLLRPLRGKLARRRKPRKRPRPAQKLHIPSFEELSRASPPDPSLSRQENRRQRTPSFVPNSPSPPAARQASGNAPLVSSRAYAGAARSARPAPAD